MDIQDVQAEPLILWQVPLLLVPPSVLGALIGEQRRKRAALGVEGPLLPVGWQCVTVGVECDQVDDL